MTIGYPPVLYPQRSGGGSPVWWTNNGAIPAAGIIGAWRAVDTPDSPWGPGPASFAESLVNLANPGTYDLSLGVAPTWTDTGGWDGDGGTTFLRTGISPDGGLLSIVVRCSNFTIANTRLFGSANAGNTNPRFFVAHNGTQYLYINGSSIGLKASAFASGTVGIARSKAYLNGADTLLDLGAWSGTNNNEIYLLGQNSGGALQFPTDADIQAVWISDYDAAAYMSDLHTIMMAL